MQEHGATCGRFRGGEPAVRKHPGPRFDPKVYFSSHSVQGRV